jgi:predicted phosphoribosyltransferase
VFGKVSGDITINSTGVAAIGSGVIVNADINASAAIADTKLDTISTANKVSLTALDIDGGTETTTIVGSDLLIVDDGANGTNRKVTVNNLFGANSTATVDGGSY